jgi:hypothetical protein
MGEDAPVTNLKGFVSVSSLSDMLVCGFGGVSEAVWWAMAGSRGDVELQMSDEVKSVGHSILRFVQPARGFFRPDLSTCNQAPPRGL